MTPRPDDGRPARPRPRATVTAAVLAALVAAAGCIGAVGVAPMPGAGPQPGKAATMAAAPTTTTTAPTTTTAAPTTTATPATTDAEPTSETDTRAMRRAALRISIHTSSDWAQVDLPGVSAGHLVARGAGAEVTPIASGVVVRGPAGVERSIEVDVVTEVPGELTDGWVTLQQGGVGSTTVTVTNRTTDPYDVLTVATRGGATVSQPVSTEALMGRAQLPWKRADQQRRVLAFTYPWFDESAATDPQLSVHPASPWRSWDPDDALRSSREARQHGIDGFVMSWAGAAQNGLALHQTLVAAEATGGTATILLETVEAGSAEVAERWIAEALEQAGNPAFMRLDGVPVVFVFDGGRLSGEQWRTIAQRLAAAGTPVELVGDTWDGQGGAMTGMFRYNAVLRTEQDLMTPAELTDWNRGVTRALRARATLGEGEPGLVVATAQPGWDDRPLRGADRLTVPRHGVETYGATWAAALAGEPDWVVITSWNEWYEGTGIAPSVEHGTTALEATAPWAQRFRG